MRLMKSIDQGYDQRISLIQFILKLVYWSSRAEKVKVGKNNNNTVKLRKGCVLYGFMVIQNRDEEYWSFIFHMIYLTVEINIFIRYPMSRRAVMCLVTSDMPTNNSYCATQSSKCKENKVNKFYVPSYFNQEGNNIHTTWWQYFLITLL